VRPRCICVPRPESYTGLYTSPHLIAVRERIRINGIPLSEEEFAGYFFEIWDKLDKDFKVPSFIVWPFFSHRYSEAKAWNATETRILSIHDPPCLPYLLKAQGRCYST
jgi:hypothetical protein